MSETGDNAAPAEATPTTAKDRPRRRRLHRWLFVGLGLTLALLVMVAAGVRYGVRTDSGRSFVTRYVDGMRIGRVGRLHVEGLQGDLFGAFTVRRLSIVDDRGAWLEALNLSVSWRPFELVSRVVHVEHARAQVVRVLRRPAQNPSTEPRKAAQVSIVLDELRTRLETLPAFSDIRGDWDIAGQLESRRDGPTNGRLDAQSRIHAGDGLKLAFQFGPKDRVLLQADAVEASGGALAGTLGLPSNQRLFVRARIDGLTSGSGRIAIVSESGALRPVVANGGWAPAGATLDARVLLSASSLTAPYAAKVGPEATIRLRANHLRDDLYQVAGSVVARDANVQVDGPVDWRRRRTDGMNLRLSVASVQRWLEVLQAGPARASGKLSGSLDRWRYQGRLEVERLDQLDYRLARLAGPATLSYSRDEIRLQADLDGAGGAGQGWLAGLLGAAPDLRLDGGRLRDGRFLIRDLHLVGSGAQLEASGDQTLLGGLSLKGTLAISALERVLPNARGALKASWTAAQRGASPWNVKFDATGASFASGYPELDRLLGPTPRVTGEASYGAQGLSIATSQINGQAAQATVKGVLRLDQSLAMDVDWRARGPFTAGPVEIAGEATGTGRIGGKTTAPTLDLTADLAAIDFGRLVVKPAHLILNFASEGGANGRIAVNGPSEFGPASASARFRFIDGGVALSDIAADAGGVKAAGALTLRDGAPSTADLTVDAQRGAFLEAGRLTGAVRLTDAAGGATAHVVLDGQGLRAYGVGGYLKTLRLRADGPWARLPFSIQADSDEPTPWRIAGDGVLTQTDNPAGAVREVAFSGTGRVQRVDLKTLEPARLRLGPGEQSVRLRLGIGAGRIEIDAKQAGQAVEAVANAVAIDLTPFNSDYTGKLNAGLRLSGVGSRLGGSLDARIQDGRNRDAPESVALDARVKATLADQRIAIDATATNPEGLTSHVAMAVPVEATAAPFRVALVRDRPISGDFGAQGELRPLWDLLVGGGRTLSGRGETNGTIGGTLASPNVSGQASIANGRFSDAPTGLELRDFTLAASFGNTGIQVRQFSGADGRNGTLSGSGEVNLERGGASSFNLHLERFQLIDNDVARATASGDVTVTRDAQGKAKLQGELQVVRADITAKPPVPTGVTPLDVVEINKPPSDSSDFRVRPPGPQVALDVKIRANRGVFVRGNGLDVELSVDAQVGGSTGATTLTGTARVVRGDYEFAGKRFEFDDRSVVRLGSRPELIRLDLTATRDDPTLTAVVSIKGTAARPEITLSSTPILPQDEVLAQILFGRSASQLTSLETAQLASALAGLATGGGLDVLGGLRELAGLDRLALGGDASGAATVSGGKYLTRNIYLELTGGGRQGPTAQVEWRVRRNFSIVSTVGSRGDARLSVRIRRNY